MEVYVLPLSSAQKRLWYQEMIHPGNNAYNIPLGLRLQGDLDKQALEKVFQTIINRHEILRTRFAVEDGEPVQLVYPETNFHLECKVLESEDELIAESRKPFNLATDELIRATLYQVQPREHILLVNMHHIISDGWSLGIFFREFSDLYSAYVTSSQASLPELPIQYGDYAEWQETWLQEAMMEKQLAYWQQQLVNLPPALDLPLEKSRPMQQSFQGATVREEIPSELIRDLEDFAKSEGATFFMTALAVFQVLLFRYSGQSDIIVGSPIANRTQAELDNLIGFFVNTLALRGNLDGNPAFREFLLRIRQTCVEAYTHQDVPFETLVDELDVKRDPSRSPIFQTFFAVQNAPLNDIQLPRLKINPIYCENGGAKFDLTLMLEPGADTWFATLEYNSDLFTSSAAQRILQHYCQLLRAVVQNPDVYVNSLPLLTKNERQELIELGSADIVSSKQKNIVELFIQTARAYPDKVAVKCQEQTLTYDELDKRSNQLAHFLQEKGVDTEVRVGIFQERSEELIVSILAVLKAGGTYVPLDPVYPQDRLSYIFADSGISLVITESDLLSSLPATDKEVVVLEEIEFTTDKPLTTKILPQQSAYIIYTSGSTGKPKGCIIPHGNVTRLMKSTEAWFGFNQNDVWTLFHSFAFDFSVWEIWGALFYGGKLVVVPYLESRSPEAFWQLLKDEDVTILNQTPSAFRQLIRVDGEMSDKLNLRRVIFGGEALELQSLRPWFERYGDKSPLLVNMYGITETTVHVTYRPITLEDVEQNRGSVIGSPIPDLSLHILDEQLEPTPIGVPGEIYVGGMGVSKGYLNRPELTAQRFIPDPFNKTGAKIYRTGDVGRRLSNGDIEYLGRNDCQVKVRGFRIELGEIESAMVALPRVAEAVVVTHSDNAEDKRLVAYIVADDVERNDLRAALKEHLPDYMIPAAFVFMDAIPLTAQGKVDRKALPAPDWSLRNVERKLTLAQTPAQEAIAQVWSTVLGIDKVGIEDNFFDLGGDSILALKVVSEMRRQGWILTPKDIFKQQTVTELATVAKQVDSEIRTVEKVVGESPLSPIQQWFFAQNLPNPHHWNQAVLLEVNKLVDSEVFAEAVNAVAAHHDIFRLRFQRDGENWRQYYAEGEPQFNFETIDLSNLDREQQDIAMKAAMNRSQSQLNISNGSLASAALFQLGERLPRLFVVVHHLIIDGVSWRILLEDLAGAISCIDAGETLQLSQPSSSFKQYSEFLQSWTLSPDIEPEKQFWLENIPDTTAIPVDFETTTAENLESSLKTISRKFTQQETETLLTTANKPYHTLPQELLLAAVAKTISNITQTQNIQLVMEGHGREDLCKDLDITRTLGWFTTLYPLSLEIPSHEEKTLITNIKERLREVSPHGLSYGLLRYLQSETEISDNLPDISFNYLGQVRNETGEDKFFSLLNQDTGLAHDPNGLRSHIIDIIAIVVEGELRIDWLYSSNLHQSKTIDKWADDFGRNLQQILHHCTTPGVGEYTPSDFPLVNLNQSAISSLTTKYPDLEDIYPLSSLQSGMLFHTLYSPDDGVYFEQLTGQIRGQLNISAFSTAWQIVVDRHPILRSAFVWENQEPPIQVVNNSVKFSVTEQDWRDLPPTQQQSQLQKYLSADKKQGFELNVAPLMRFTLIRLDDSTWQWVWSHHHLLLDGWSLPIIFKEVLEIYQSVTKGIPYHLDTVPPYRNYIEWLLIRDRQQAEEFWCEQLAGICEPTPISQKQAETTDVAEFEPYEAIDLRLSDEEFAALQTMAQNHRITLNTLAQGAWALLLQKYGAGEDVLFGATVSGRPPEITDVENMVGLFINTLPMGVKLNPDVTVAAWLQEIQQRQVQMREYEYSKLTDIRQIAGFPSGEPMFESILVFENYPVNESLKNQGEDIQVDNIEFHERTNYPLTVAFVPDTGLLLKLNYETKFLSPPAAKLMLQRLRRLLVELAQKPEVSLGEVDILSARERHLAIDEWNLDVNNRTDAEGAEKINLEEEICCAHQLFEKQADLEPNTIALVFGDDAITYGELEQRANILADILQSSGVTHESIVGLYFEPSTDFIVALLAVLKAGGAFLPLDMAYPQERLQFILEDSRASLVLTKEKLHLDYEASKTIALSEIDWTNTKPRINLRILPENLAYVIYTSGSTGKPKGVLVTHSGIQNLVNEQSVTFGVTKQSRIYQLASLNFDAAVFEIFMALGNGAILYLKPQAERFPGPALWAALTAWEISHLTIVPSLLATIKPEELPTLKTLIVAGEAASASLLNRWSKAGCQIINAYGPSEATVCTSMKDCSDLVGEPSIGRAIKNTQMYLLDKYFQPVAPGIPGEIFISGIGLARGYLNRADLTAAAFIPHPYSTQPGARLYCSGDTGFYDPQGNIHFIGRQDNRVKLHGYRIELSEIETALTKHPTVDSAVVLLREDVPARPRLVAYALTSTTQVTDRDLLDYLSGVLPKYMVPSALVIVKQWSLTPNGKINRKALRAPEIPTHKSDSIPTNETEKILSQIWAEVLGLETVGTDDNFFEIGGDSIISLQIVSRAREAELEINPKDIFEAQTLGRLAAITKPLTKKVEVVEPKTGKIPLSPIQHWFFERKLPHQHQWNQTVALSVNQTLQIDALLAALEAVVSHHDAFRFKYQQNQDIWEQSYIGDGQSPPLRIKDFSKYPVHQQAKALAEVIEEEQVFFNLGCPPLLRVLYVSNLAEYGDALILFAHHLVVDGVSWRILIEDLNQAYHQEIAGKPVSLPTKTSSYREWTTNLEKLANSPEIEQDIPFWKETITTPTIALPLDKQTSPESNTVESSAIETCQLSSTETLELLKSATANYHANVQEILLVALLETITNWTESDNLLIDLEGHGRENIVDELDLSRTVGWFTSLYPVLLQKPRNHNLENLFKQVKTQLRAIPHHGISFGLLRYLNQHQTFINGNRADISFNYLGQLDNQQNNNKLFNLSNIPVGSSMFPQQKRPHILAINARIQNEQLIIDWSYSQNLHDAQTIHHLAQNYLNHLHNYLGKTITNTANFYAASDFNLVNLEESELDSILADLEN